MHLLTCDIFVLLKIINTFNLDYCLWFLLDVPCFLKNGRCIFFARKTFRWMSEDMLLQIIFFMKVLRLKNSNSMTF